MHLVGREGTETVKQEVGLIYSVLSGLAANKILMFELQQPERRAGYWVKTVRR